MEYRKPVVAIDLSSTGAGGGPYTSSMRLINSALKECVDYKILEYKTETGRFISIKRIRDLAGQLKSIKPDIVHFSGLQLSGFHIAVACKLAGVKKSVVVIRGSTTEAMDVGVVKKTLTKWLEMITLLLVTTFYGVSKYASELPVTRFFRRKSSGYIYNLPPTAGRSEAVYERKSFGFGEEDVIVVSTGRITKDKGYPVLQEVIKRFKEHPQVRFLIAGTGSYLETMRKELSEQEAGEQVRFLGYRDDVERILPMCDIFVLPTLHETLSNSLLEASEFGIPLVGSNVGGVPEIIESGYNGLLVEKGNVEELYRAVEYLAGHADERKKMGLNAGKKLADKFAEKELLDKVKIVYKRLL